MHRFLSTLFAAVPGQRLCPLWRGTARARLFGLLVVAFAAGCSSSGDDGVVGVGDSLPTLKLQALDDGAESLAPFRGRLLVVNIWATWCSPCREEMPSLQRLSERFPGERFALVGISIDDDANLVREFLLRYGIEFPILLDPEGIETTAALGSLGYPDTLIVDAEGRVVRRVTGLERWDSPAMIDFIEGHLPPVPGGS